MHRGQNKPPVQPPRYNPPFKKVVPPVANFSRPLQNATNLATYNNKKSAVDKEAEENKKRQHYLALFDRIEAHLTLDMATDADMLKQISELARLTIEIHEKHGDTGLVKDSEMAKMDACGTQLWNIAVSLLQHAGDNLSKEEKQFIINIRSIALMQLELGAARPWGRDNAVRVTNAMIQAALFSSPFSIEKTQEVLDRCKKILPDLHKMDDVGSNVIAAECQTSYHCAKYTYLIASGIGTPEYELERAIESCKGSAKDSWAYHETINNCIEHAHQLYQQGMNLATNEKKTEDRLSKFKTAQDLFIGVIELMEAHDSYRKSSIAALKQLAHCHYELAQANNDESQYDRAYETLLKREASLDDQVEGRAIAQSRLLRLEIKEEKGEDVTTMLNLWKSFAEGGEIKSDDIARIIRLLAHREDQRLFSGTYIFQVCLLVIQAIMRQQENERVRMVGKLLLYLIEAIKESKDFQQLHDVLTHISNNEFVISAEVALSCQIALFKHGDDRKDHQPYLLAGHVAFASEPINMSKAIRKAAWTLIEQGNYTQALQVLRSVPAEKTSEYCMTMLSYCIAHMHLKDEAHAIESLKAMLDLGVELAESDKVMEMLPLIINEAQTVNMKKLQMEALQTLAGLLDSEGKASLKDLLVIVRTVISLQIEIAAREGGLNVDTYEAFCGMVQLGMNKIALAFGDELEQDTIADIATWMIKVVYSTSTNESHAIPPAVRVWLCDYATFAFKHRIRFSKPIDDESYHVNLYARLHQLTGQATQAKSVDVTDEEAYHQNWNQVALTAQHSLRALQDAMQHNTIGSHLKGADTAIEVVLVDAIVKLKMWDEIEGMMIDRKSTMSFDAIEIITDTVCNDQDAPYTLKSALLMRVIDALWNHNAGTTSDLPRFASWTLRLIENHLNERSIESIDRFENMLQSVYNYLSKNEEHRRKWPKDILQFMSNKSWEVGKELIEANYDENGDALLATAVKIAQLEENSKERVIEMNKYLTAFKAAKEANQRGSQ